MDTPVTRDVNTHNKNIHTQTANTLFCFYIIFTKITFLIKYVVVSETLALITYF